MGSGAESELSIINGSAGESNSAATPCPTTHATHQPPTQDFPADMPMMLSLKGSDRRRVWRGCGGTGINEECQAASARRNEKNHR